MKVGKQPWTAWRKIAAASALLVLAYGVARLAPTGGEEGTSDQRPEVAAAPASSASAAEALTMLASLRAGGSNKLAGLKDWRALLLRMDPAAAIALIRAELAKGDDFASGGEFVIGKEGRLASWPSFRVFLLDVLYEIDPQEAAAVSREVLGYPTTADEWALAMRNLGKASQDPADLALLKAKSAEMLANTEWSARPSVGYLEAFDVIVHTRHVELAPDLVSSCDKRDARAVRHASFLTLDRLMQAEPLATGRKLMELAVEHPSCAPMISNMVARADLRAAGQRALVEAYLLDTRRTARELQAFSAVFPNANQMVSLNLLTTSKTFEGPDLQAQDQAAEEVVSAWLQEPRFAPVKDTLLRIQARLRSFHRH